MGKQAKLIDIKDMTQLNLEKLYCFMLDITEQSQLTNSDDVALSLLSPNVKKFPLITDKIMPYSVTDWREGPIQYLVDLGIIKCYGVNKKLPGPPISHNSDDYFQGIELTILNIAKFTNFLKKVEAVYKSKSADGQQINTESVKSKSDTATKNQLKIPPISNAEAKKYDNRYPRRDVIEFLDRETDNRNYIIRVNKKEVSIPYSLYILILFLAIKLKSDMDDGWATIKELEAADIAIEGDIHHTHQVTSNLNKILHHFIESNTVELIQNMKRASKYRLSTMPSRIKAPHTMWLKQTLTHVKNCVLKERQIRKDQKIKRDKSEQKDKDRLE